jgi:RNA polymerase sigma-70 factor (ECF subfamily)
MNMDISAGSFDVIWSQMHKPLCRFVCSRVSNAEDAEDILQDVFLRIYHKQGTIRDPERLESWMYQIARNRVSDHYRRPRLWTDLPDNLPSEVDNEEDMIEPLLGSVREIVTTLPEPYRQALIRSDFDGIPQQELAREEGIGLSGIKSRVQRARLKVKESLLDCYDIEFDPRGQVLDIQDHCCC